MKEDLSIGEVARIYGVSPRTATRWFDCGIIAGWRLPISGDRRVTREAAAKFGDSHGFPVAPDLTVTVLAVSLVNTASMATGLKAACGGYAARIIESCGAFEAGAKVALHKPDAIVVDTAIGRVDARIIAAGAKSLGVGVAVAIAFHAEPEPGFDATVSRDMEMPTLGQLVGKMVLTSKGV